MGKKKKSPKQGKKKSPKQGRKKSPQGVKPRAQWTVLLEKSLVDILHEHDTPYHRGQNGWSGESWSAMVDMFHQRNPHVRFDKSQFHDKEKELKRDYRMLKDALGQSGVGWIDSEYKLDAEPHLWENMATVNQRQAGLEHVEVTQTHARVAHVEANQRNGAGPSTNKPRKRKRSPKMKPKTTGDALVGVIDRFVNIKEKEVNNKAVQQFTISKCIAALRTLQGFDPSEKPKAFVVLKSVDNPEIFLSSVEDNDGSALTWLRSEMAKLP
ncbi:hypothetical protein ACQ4PT_009249 [Festuca glaucescens]